MSAKHGNADYLNDESLLARIATRVAADPDVVAAPEDRAVLRRAVARGLAAEGVVVSPTRWASMVRDLVDELGGLGPVESLLRDPDVTDVMINSPSDVWVERAGQLDRSDIAFRDAAHVRQALDRVLGPVGVRLDRAHPWADATLPGGVRLHAVLPPLAQAPIVTLRRIASVVPTWDELIVRGAVTVEGAELLRDTVRGRANVLVSGAAGAGKTTLLARMLHEVDGDRVVIIEDAPELAIRDIHAVNLRVRPESPDAVGGVDVATLVRNALRMRPDRLVVGEVRGHEVADMLQAMNTGHAGSMTTVHANGPGDALTRVHGMALLAGLPDAAATVQVAAAVDVVVHLERDRSGRRRVAAVSRVSIDAGGWVLDEALSSARGPRT